MDHARRSAQDTGARIYAAICSSCHQASGAGLDTTYPPLAGSEWVTGSPERLVRIILHGITGEIDVQGELFRGLMPPWGPSLSDHDVAAVASYVRRSWGNRAPAVAESTVVRIRRTTADRYAPWTQEELLRIKQ